MSLLVEPANTAACQRNAKEQKLREGTLHRKSQTEYILAHMGIGRQRRQTAQAGAVIAGSASQPQLGLVDSKARPKAQIDYSDIMSRYGGSRPALRSSAASSYYTESEYEVRPESPDEPRKVESVRLGKQPLFSPQLCAAVSRQFG
mmetsp:Transcript_19042/g.30949  ORF Transcript_19042/g.30949 Transcript_19042/m.30949 type:complete len:146 (+) Transcript_19042:67-504(+)|eukprot:CAMPEP_0169125872 /NCGR_PEP_ID=MMETSP1015-20121227/35127_1 /TAXON_ID=342587 /ORGANISM="Karlodinium micrum, Strain CCMP2283" /LENGTH=145 /DNA_ID=CAMNT_0009189459 /DNA_START=67 /DNA_END=504 /DNA_ORIENTATION=-